MKLIRFEIKELKKDSALLLDDFLSELGNIKKTLDSLNEDLHPNGTGQLSYEIVKLRKESPTYVEILPRTKGNKINGLIDNFYEGLKFIPQGKIPKDYSTNTIKAYSQIGLSTTRNELIFYGSNKKNKLKIKESFDKYINEIEQPRIFTEHGSISGKLDALNFHGTKKILTIYPNYAPAVNCIIDENFLSVIEKAIQKKVTITGKIKRKINEKYPFEIFVENIKIHKSSEEIPKVDELWGMVN